MIYRMAMQWCLKKIDKLEVKANQRISQEATWPPATVEVKTVQQTSKDRPREILEVILLEVHFGIFFIRIASSSLTMNASHSCR